MTNRVQTIRYYTTLQRPPVTEYSGELYINYADIQIGALNKSHSPVDFVAVRYYSQTGLYVEGDFVVYNGVLYCCTENTVIGPFDSTRWSTFANLQDIKVLIAVETTRAEAAEASLQNEINTEIARAKAAEANLQTEVNNLQTEVNNLQTFPSGISLDYYGVTVPTGWLLEDGSVYNISTYPTLGALLGSKFGGDGSTTFAVPNSLGRFGVASNISFPFGSTGGTVSTTLNATMMPSHTHTIQPHNHTLTQTPHTHAFGSNIVGLNTNTAPIGFAAGNNAPPAATLDNVIQPANANITINATGVLVTDATGGVSGVTAPINTLPPYISRTRIIKT